MHFDSSPASQAIVLVSTGLLAGFIDSIAGGGGLINLPVLTLMLGPGAHAIGTNKISGMFAALVALLVYLRAGHLDIKRSIAFTAWVAIGAFCGSRISPFFPPWIFQWLLLITCPVILFIVWKKDLWINQEIKLHGISSSLKWYHVPEFRVFISGIICGLYDGAWGPGGGTFMFLSLLFFAKLPIISALAAAKLANTFSAASALTGYAISGYVHWHEGLVMAAGISAGAFIGARNATKHAARIIRPILAVVASLLLIRMFF
jgi:uncharacterized membrane protein YfcA